jgi:cytoskeletal protein CcmA (bactofilin family)
MSYVMHAALLTIPALGFASLALDLGSMRAMSREAQNAADSAALASAAYVSDGKKVQSVGLTFASMHSVGAEPVKSADVKIDVGRWDKGVFTLDSTGKFARATVTVSRAALLAPVLGVDELQIERSSVATIRAPIVCTIQSLSSSQDITLNGSATIDGYDSTLSSLSSPTFSATAGACSNKTSVKVTGNIDVLGSVYAGTGGTVTVSGSATVTGDRGALTKPLVYAPVVKPSSTKVLVDKIQSTVTLTPGNYYRKGSFDITSKGVLNLTGETNLYIEGSAQFNGQVTVNSSQDPHRLNVYLIGSGSLQINGGAVVYGSMIAPQGTIDLNGNSEFYGIVIADQVKINGNIEVHTDTSLVAEADAGGSAALIE